MFPWGSITRRLSSATLGVARAERTPSARRPVVAIRENGPINASDDREVMVNTLMPNKPAVLSKTSKYLIAYVVASLIATAFLVYSGTLDSIEQWAETNNFYPAHFEGMFIASMILGIAVMVFFIHGYFQYLRKTRLRSKYNNQLSYADEEAILNGRALESVFPPVLTAKKELERSLDSMEDMVILCDAEGVILRCNRAFKNLVGSEYRNILGKPIGSIFSEFGVELKDLDLKNLHARVDIQGRWFTVNSHSYDDVEMGPAVRTVLVMRALTGAKEPGKVHFLWGRRPPGGQRSGQDFGKEDLQ